MFKRQLHPAADPHHGIHRLSEREAKRMRETVEALGQLRSLELVRHGRKITIPDHPIDRRRRLEFAAELLIESAREE